MPGLYSRLIRPIHLAGDIILINACFFVAYWTQFNSFSLLNEDLYWVLILYYNLAWFVVAFFLKVYQLYRVTGFVGIVINLVRALAFYLLLIVAFNGMVTMLGYSRLFIIYSFSLISGMILIWRLALYVLLRVYRKSGYNYRRVIIAGYNEASQDLRDFFIKHPEHGYRFMGFFDDHATQPGVQGGLKELETFCLNNDVDEIYCLSSKLSHDELDSLIDFADKHFLRIKLLPDMLGLKYKNFKMDLYGYLPVVSVRNIPLDSLTNKILKRGFDILFSFLVCTLILSWLIPLIAIIIRLDSRGPIFFKQKRSGLNNKEFWCYKFRSMRVNHDAHLKQATKGDARITAVGEFLRKTSLDELPQFFNVLIGNMSVVGPRPHMLKHTEEYSELIDKYMLRHLIKPGITGLSQVMGFRGTTEDPHLMRKRVKMDIYYIENWTFWLDLRIIIQTVWGIFKGDDNAF